MFRREERILLGGAGLWAFGEGMLGPLFAIFGERVGGNVLEISWAWAVYLIVFGSLVILAGRYSDKVNKGRLMVAGFGLNAALTFCYLLVNSPASLLALQAGLGVAAALATPTWDALYARYEDRKHDGATWGIGDGSIRVLAGTGLLIGGVIVTATSFEMLFMIMGTVQVMSSLFVLQLVLRRPD
jgi:MFS family permease